jgi:hypothetical protein
VIRICKGNRVGYKVSIGAGSSRYETVRFGIVTSGWRSRLGRVRVRIRVENPEPGAAQYVERYLLDTWPAHARKTNG